MELNRTAEMVLGFNRVSYTYYLRRRQVPVLTDLSFEIADGERVAVVGPSGSGKTTVLTLASGLATPQGGSVSVCGEITSELSAERRAALRLHNVAHIFQDFRLVDNLDALENVALALRLRGLSKQSSEEQALEALGKVGMGRRLAHKPRQLSGGEKQRVAIARACVTRPRLLLADEPSGSLDTALRDEVFDVIFETLPDASIVTVTHDDAVAERMSRVVQLSA